MSQERKHTIALTLEHDEREFLPKCLLARALCDAGFRVYIGSTESVDIAAKNLKPAILFHKSVWPQRSEHYKSLGHKFVFLDEEGGLTTPRAFMKEFCEMRYGEVNAKNTDLVLLPGPRYLEEIKLNNFVENVPMAITGWPRIDLWRAKYREIHSAEAKVIKEAQGNFYLFPTSFGAASKERLEKMVADATTHLGRKNLELRLKAFLDYTSLIRELSQSLSPGYSIVIRPHPSESTRAWKREFRGVKRVKIIRQGDIAPWILASSGTIQFGSSSVIQSAMFGKTNVQYRVMKQEGVTDTPSFELAQDFQNVSDLMAFLCENSGTEQAGLVSETMALLKDEIAYDEKELAVDKITRLMKMEALEISSPLRLSIMGRLRINIIFFGSHLKKLINQLTRIVFEETANQKVVAEKLPKGVGGHRVEEIMHKLDEIDGNLSPRLVKQVSKNLVSLEGLGRGTR